MTFLTGEVRVVSKPVLQTRASCPAMKNNRHILSTFTFIHVTSVCCSLHSLLLLLSQEAADSELGKSKAS